MGSHVPEGGQQCARYYGAYANAVRGRQQKREAEEPIPTVLEPELCSREAKRNWAPLIRKVYETDPLVCLGYQNRIRAIAPIEAPRVIRRMLERLGLWLANARPVPKEHSPPVQPVPIEPFFSQLPALEVEDFSQVPPAHWEYRITTPFASI